MVQGAKERTRIGKRIKDSKKTEADLYSLIRRSNTPTGIQVPFLSGAGASSNVGEPGALKTAGGTMIGPIAFFPRLVSIASGAIDIGSNTNNFSSRVIVSPETGLTDDLVTISNAEHAGQLLFLQGVQSDTITIKTTGNIETIDGNDFTLADDDIIIFMFDTTDNKWQQITIGKQGATGTGTGTSISAGLSSNQTTNFAVNDHVEFDTVDEDGGIVLQAPDAPASQNNGIFELKAGKRYALFGIIGPVWNGTANTAIALAWYDRTNSAQLGRSSEIQPTTNAQFDASNPECFVVHKPTTDITVDLRVIGHSTVAADVLAYESGQTSASIFELGGGSGGGTLDLPIQHEINNVASPVNPVTLDLSTGDGHVWKYAVSSDLTFAATVLNIPPNLTQRTFELEFEYGGTGTHTVTLPSNFADENGNALASFDISSGTALLSVRINDGTNFLVVQRNVVAVTNGASELSNITIDVSKDWNAQSISNLAGIAMSGVTATISGVTNLNLFQAGQSINSLSGEIDYIGAALDRHRFIAGATEIARFEEIAASVYRLDMLSHEIHNSREVSFDLSTEAVIASTEAAIGYSPTTDAAVRYHAPSGKSHIKQIAGDDIMTLSATNLTFVDGHQTIFNPDATNPGVNIGLAVGDPSATNNGDLWYNASTNKFRTKENGVNVDVISSGGVGALDDLSDVSISSPVALEVLRYDGAEFSNAILDIGNLGDVIITAPATNAVLKYNGTNWIDSLIQDGDLPATVVHSDLVTNFTQQVTFAASSTSLVVTNQANFNGNVNLGNGISDTIDFNGKVDTDINIDGGKAIRSENATEIGFLVRNDTGSIGSLGTVQIPISTTSIASAAVADSRFGAFLGAIGMQELGSGSPVLFVRQADGNWSSVLMGRDALT